MEQLMPIVLGVGLAGIIVQLVILSRLQRMMVVIIEALQIVLQQYQATLTRPSPGGPEKPESGSSEEE